MAALRLAHPAARSAIFEHEPRVVRTLTRLGPGVALFVAVGAVGERRGGVDGASGELSRRPLHRTTQSAKRRDLHAAQQCVNDSGSHSLYCMLSELAVNDCTKGTKD